MKKLRILFLTMVFATLLSTMLVVQPVASTVWQIPGWEDWQKWKQVTLTETAGISRTDEPVDISVTFDTSTPVDDIRVLDSSYNEVPSQVYNVVTDGSGRAVSADVAFLADCPASSSVTYYIIYKKKTPGAPPVYDGLRLHTIAAGDSYNVTALVTSVENNYFHIFWKSMFDLYSNGNMVALGNIFWGFGQISLATMWNDAWGATWFGAGKELSILDSGPVFVEFNYSESYATDWLSIETDFNVTKTDIVRVWYQPDLNPLVQYNSAFTIKTNLPNYTISGPVFMDFRLRNSTTQAIYLNLTYNQGWFGTTTIPVETSLLWTSIWYPPWALYGWWSYNGSRPDSADKPAANIGLIPVDASGTVSADYQVSFTHDTPADHHCTQWMIGKYNGTTGQYAGTKGYIVTYSSSLPPAEPYMPNKATKVRNALTYTLSGEQPTAGVGGTISPVEKTALLAPWIILAAIVTVAAMSVASHKKHHLKTL